MNQQQGGEKQGVLDAKQAEQFARSLNMVFNNALTYGLEHPIVRKNIEEYFKSLSDTLTAVSMLTVMLERDALYIEETRVDKKMNATRLTTTFKNSGMQSVSFARGVTIDEVQVLVNMLRESKSFRDIEQMKEYLQRENVSNIRLNYVLYQKITEDESVIDKTGELQRPAAPQGSAPATSSETEAALKGLTSLFSMAELVKNPQGMAQNLVSAASGASQDQRAAALSYLGSLSKGEAGAGDGDTPLSSEQIIEAVLTLKQDLKEGLEVQKQLGKIISDEGVLVNEVDRLTYQVVVRMAREEYRSGGISVKRLARVIRRMMPDIQELKRLLPMLKEGLVAEGMSLGDFLELVRELNLELKSDSIADMLEEGASEIGLGADDIIRGIKANPGEAARLIVLASEIRQGTRGDDSHLSKLLTDYVERVSSQMTLQSDEVSGQEGGKAMERVIGNLEQQLLTRLKAQGLSDSLLRVVQKELSSRLPDTIRGAKSKWLMEFVAKSEVSAPDLIHLVGSLVDNENDLHSIADPLTSALVAKGFSPQQIQEVLEKTRTRLQVRKSISSQQLPKGVLSVNNTVFFLQREIGLLLRYNNPFSTLMVTVPYLLADAQWRPPTSDESVLLFPQIFSVLTGALRDLDIIGSMGALAKNVPYVILSMTDREGGQTVKNRLQSVYEKTQFVLESTPVNARAAVSVTTFDKQQTHDLKEFLALAKQNHSAAESEVLSNLRAGG